MRMTPPDVPPSPASSGSIHDQATRERLETLGSLASGIAHDLNNLIMAIQGNAESGLRELKTTEPAVEKALKTILLATRNSRELTGQILAFTRNQKRPFRKLGLPRVIQETLKLLEVNLPSNIRVVWDKPDKNWAIEGHPGQMHQLLMNLCTNALQAMQPEGGTLHVSLCHHKRQENRERVDIIIADSGKGIREELKEKIFDPFFTTKSIGMGNGLGLAVVRDIVQQHHGDISLESSTDSGTTFTISLPCVGVLDEEQRSETLNPFGTIKKKAALLVDDEPFMRGLGMDMLQSLGFRVSVASNGREAMELIQRKPDYFDIIVSDSKMPEMNGLELADAARKIRPDIPFALVTAFADNEAETKIGSLERAEILQKPFLFDGLKRCLERLLKEPVA